MQSPILGAGLTGVRLLARAGDMLAALARPIRIRIRFALELRADVAPAQETDQ